MDNTHRTPITQFRESEHRFSHYALSSESQKVDSWFHYFADGKRNPTIQSVFIENFLIRRVLFFAPTD
jgi:hypothetical protein